MPLINPLTIQLAATGLGFGLNKLFNKRPEPNMPDPDEYFDGLRSDVEGEFDVARRRTEEANSVRYERALDDAAASGRNPLSFATNAHKSANQSAADLNARESDAVARVEQSRAAAAFGHATQQAQMNYQQELGEYQSRGQAISSMASGVGQYFQNKEMLQSLSELSASGDAAETSVVGAGEDALGVVSPPGPTALGRFIEQAAIYKKNRMQEEVLSQMGVILPRLPRMYP